MEYRLVIPNSQQYSLKFLLSNWRPLSEMSMCGVPKRVIIFFPNEFLGIHVPDVGQRFSLHPFGEIISSDYYVSLIPCCFGERTDNIKTPLSKRPGAGERVKDSSGLVDIWGESLTLITLLCIFLGLPLHVRPPVSLGKCPVRQQSSSGVTSTNLLM